MIRTILTAALVLLPAGTLVAQQPVPRLPVAPLRATAVEVRLAAAELESVALALAAIPVPDPAALPLPDLEPVARALAEIRLPDVAALPLPELPLLGDERARDGDVLPPEGWAPQDPADSLWRAARRAINDGDYQRAAELYFKLHEDARFRNSEYRGQAYYWEAFARARVGGRSELHRARAALEAMRARHADEWRAQRDAAALLTRVNAELAQRGDEAAARDVAARGRAAVRGGCDEASMGMKVEAMNALLQMDAAQAMPILEEVMKKRDECSAELRRKAIFLIAQKPGEQSHRLILEAVENDPDPEVREQAVFWLSQVSGDEAVRALEHVLATSKERKVQEHALFALSQHRSPRATTIIRDYVVRADVSPDLRKHAIFALSQRADPQTVAFLKEIYPKVDRDVKEMVVFTVSQQRDDSAGQWLLDLALDEREDVEVRKNALFFVGQRRGMDVARLGQLYDRMPSTEMKEQVIFVLSQRNDAAAVDRLMTIAKNEKDPELRKRAIFWLGQSKDPRAARFLLDIINN